MEREQLKSELEKHFSSDFFPATKNDIVEYFDKIPEYNYEVYIFIKNLEDDIDFKYNSIDDLLPADYIYPLYKQACNFAFVVKILSPTKSLYIFKNKEINITDVEANIYRWSKDWKDCTEVQFKSVYLTTKETIDAEANS